MTTGSIPATIELWQTEATRRSEYEYFGASRQKGES